MSKRNPAPLIGITCEAVSKRKDFADYDLLCDHRYAAAIIQAGGHPVLLPIAHDQLQLVRYLEGINGLVIVGGDDLDPCWYGERAKKRTKIAFSKRSEFEAWLYRAGKKRGLPIFGICYGMQLINVLEGGTLVQHIHPNKHKPSVDHEGKKTGYHSVKILPHTRLSGLIGEGRKIVATEHHQGIRSLAPHFIPSAIASDGMVEAIEHPSKPHIFTVQWHPERQPASRISRRLFRAFVRSCCEYQTRKNS